MKKSFLHKLSALILIAALTGCQAGPVLSADKAGDTAPDTYPFAMEYPAIGDDPGFSGDSIAVSVQNMAVKKAPAEVKAVWIAYLEFEQILKNKTSKQFRASIQSMFDKAKDFGLNTVIVQVRPFADALYKSSYFPWSHTITGTEGKDPGFDPLKIMVAEAKARGLRIEAWINPYRVRPADRKDALTGSNQASKWLKAKDESVISYKGVISYNPASTKAQELIVNGVVEIVKNYDVDGIHIDDYFYPTMDKAFDSASYAKYTNGGGKLALYDWRRANVEKLIKKMYSSIKAANKNVLFGISPQSSVYNNYNGHYLDVKKVAANTGYCDYICPQIYFGFENDTQPYAETLKEWSQMVTAPGVKLYVGIAAYKAGAADSWAGSGKNEWRENSNLLARMVKEARAYKNYGGVAVYRYQSLFEPAAGVKTAVQKEAKNLKECLK